MNKINPIDDLQEIRKMMESSSKFISLSGLSGVFAGLTALAGSAGAYLMMKNFSQRASHYFNTGKFDEKLKDLNINLLLLAAAILIVAIGFGLLFTSLKAKRNGQKLITPVAFRLVRSLMTPLIFGGIFTLGLYYQKAYVLVAPAMLIFYGMSLMNASKYVEVELKYLALCQMALGAISVFLPYYGLIFWALGFGVLHIFYGTIMWWKYDRNH